MGTGLVRGQKQDVVDLAGVFFQNSGNFRIGTGDAGELIRQAVGQLLQHLHGAFFRGLGSVTVISCLVHEAQGHGACQEEGGCRRCGSGGKTAGFAHTVFPLQLRKRASGYIRDDFQKGGILLGKHLPYGVTRSADVHDPVHDVGNLFQAGRKGYLRIAGNQQGIDVLCPAQLDKG